jgi:hypothetical protein
MIVSLTAVPEAQPMNRAADEQSIPLFKALSYGAASIEADIYLVHDELLVSASHLHCFGLVSNVYRLGTQCLSYRQTRLWHPYT